MSNVFGFLRAPAVTATTANTVVGIVDISKYDYLALAFKNRHATVTVTTNLVEVAFDSPGTDSPSNWMALNTAVYPYPNTAAVSSISVVGSEAAFLNPYKWMRLSYNASTTMIANLYEWQWCGKQSLGRA